VPERVWWAGCAGGTLSPMSQQQQQPPHQPMTPSRSPGLASRVLAGATAVLVALFLVIYLAAVRSQAGQPAVWLMCVLVAVIALSGAAVAGRLRAGMTVSAVVLGVCALLGAFSVGLLLVPALVTAILSAALARPRTRAAVRPRAQAQA